jgi:hypothetical protein
MTQHERATFTRGREVIEHSVRYLTEVRDVLDELRERDLDERVAMLLNSVEVEQRNLLGAIERLLDDASDQVLGTYAQYTVELPVEIGMPELPLTTLGLVQWLEGVNRPLQDLFAALAEKGDSQEAAEAFAALAGQVEAHSRRLSMEYQRMEDL